MGRFRAGAALEVQAQGEVAKTRQGGPHINGNACRRSCGWYDSRLSQFHQNVP